MSKKGIIGAIARLGTAILARVRPDLAQIVKAGDGVLDQIDERIDKSRPRPKGEQKK